MAKGGLLKTLRKYNPLKRVSTTLILIVLLIIILFSVFNRKIIENNTNKSTTGGSTTKGSTPEGSPKEGSPKEGSPKEGPPPTCPNKKILEVNLWYDSTTVSGTKGARILLFDDLEAAKIEGANCVIFNKNKAEDYIAFFMTDLSNSNLRTDITKTGENWETWKKNFLDQQAPIISFSVLDKSRGNTIATGAKRKYLAAVWHTMPVSYDVLNYMLVANKYENEIGVTT